MRYRTGRPFWSKAWPSCTLRMTTPCSRAIEPLDFRGRLVEQLGHLVGREILGVERHLERPVGAHHVRDHANGHEPLPFVEPGGLRHAALEDAPVWWHRLTPSVFRASCRCYLLDAPPGPTGCPRRGLAALRRAGIPPLWSSAQVGRFFPGGLPVSVLHAQNVA